jgi:TetR/AcrR family acrAB operon transcriptional repressor
MAIIVDKIQKRKDIALACQDIFIQKGINDLTVSQIAKAAGVGKGTIYDYFKNKEDIVFQIVNILMQKHNKMMHIKLDELTTTRKKIKQFSSIFYEEEEKELRSFYKEFTSISLTNPDKEMIEFQTQHTNHYYNWLLDILNEGIKNGEIKEGSQDLARGLFVSAKGMFIASSVTNTIDDLKSEIHKFIDTIFDLIEVRR